jgi:hypothetical protein
MGKRNRIKGKSSFKTIPDPEDSWAKVELYRWQHGELPINQKHSLDESKALMAMADAIEKGCKENDSSIMPSPYNVCAVLRYMAKKINN